MIRVEQDYQEQRKTLDSEGNYTSVEMPYIVFGCDDEDDALNCVYRAIDKELYSLPLESVEIQERCNDKTYRVNVTYRKEQADSGGGSFHNNDSEEPTVSFDCGGGTKHMQYSLSRKRCTAIRIREVQSDGTAKGAMIARSQGWIFPLHSCVKHIQKSCG